MFINKKMATVTIDGKEYDSENLSDNAKNQLNSLQFVQNETNRLSAQLAVFRTAAAAYTSALKKEIESEDD